MDMLKNVITKEDFIRLNKMALKTSYARDIKGVKNISQEEYFQKAYVNKVITPNQKLLKALTSCQAKEVQKLFSENQYMSANVADHDGNIAIDIALQTNCWEIIFFLIAHGAEYKHLVKKFNGVTVK